MQILLKEKNKSRDHTCISNLNKRLQGFYLTILLMLITLVLKTMVLNYINVIAYML